MEQGKENLGNIAAQSGLTVDEARVFKCLRNARNLYHPLPDNQDKNPKDWDFHVDALFTMLMWGVVKRDHPQDWSSVQEEQANGKEQ